jgi:DNA-binding transcriptional LysR family regulator
VRPEAGGLTVRKLGVQAYAVYAAKGLLSQTRRPTKKDLAKLSWIGWDASIQHLVQARWQREHFPDAHIALTANSLFTQLHAAEQGLGLVVLPCYIADRHPQLTRCLSPTQCVSQDIWLVIQQGLRDAPRVRVIADMVAAVVNDNHKYLAGNPS